MPPLLVRVLVPEKLGESELGRERLVEKTLEFANDRKPIPLFSNIRVTKVSEYLGTRTGGTW